MSENDGSKNTKVGVGLTLGICIGTAIGAATDNMGVWIALGVSMGLVIGAATSTISSEKGEDS